MRKLFVLVLAALMWNSFAGGNLVPSGNFNTPKGDRPDGWALWTWAPSGQTVKAEAVYTEKGGIDNSPCVELKVGEAGHVAVVSSNYLQIKMEPGVEYLITAQVKTTAESFPGQIEFSLGFTDREGKRLPGAKHSYRLLQTDSHQQALWRIKVPENADKARLDLSLRKVGEIQVDDVKITRAVSGPEKPLPMVKVGKCLKAPLIDGSDDDACWEKAVSFGFFQMPRGYGLPADSTEVRLNYDTENLYLFIRNHDRMLNPVLNQLERFRAREKQHGGAIWFDDCNELVFAGKENGSPYRLIINSNGAIYGEGEIGGVTAQGQIHDSMWTLEVSVPLDKLEMNHNEFRLNVCRTRWTGPEVEHSSWIPTGNKGFNDPTATGLVKCVPEVPPAVNRLEVDSQALRIKHQTGWVGSTRYHIAISNGVEGVIVNGPNIDPATISLFQTGRDNIKQYQLQYELAVANEIFYRSPPVTLKAAEGIKEASSRLVRVEFGGKVEYIEPDGFYIMAGTMEQLSLLLYSSLPQKDGQIRFHLELPLSCRLLSEPGYPNHASPVKISENTGENSRRYILTFDRKYVNGADTPNWNLIPIPLFIAAEKPLKDKIRYYAETEQGSFREESKELELTVLPEIVNRRVSDALCFMIWEWFPFQNITRHPIAAQKRIFDKYRRVGFNAISTELSLNTIAYRRMLKDEFGLRSAKMLPTLTGAANFPFGGDYVKKHPEDAEVSYAGTKLPTPGISGLLEGKSAFIGTVDHVIGEMAKNYDIIHLDYEFGIFKPGSPGYSEANRNAFAAQYNLKNVSQADLSSKYRKQWIEFRVAQNGKMMRLYRNAVDKSGAKCLLSAYSAYQREPERRENYGMDWATLSDGCDFISCGYGRGNYAATRAVIAKDMQIMAGIGMFGFDRDLNRAVIDCFRRITDGNSFMIFSSGNVDGRVWHAAGRAIALVNDYPDFFTVNRRRDDLIRPRQDAITVLTSGDERLVFVFNESKSPAKFKFKNLEVKPGMAAWDYEQKAPLELDREINISLNPLEVKIIFIGKKENFRNSSGKNKPSSVKEEAEHFPGNPAIEALGVWQPVDWSSYPYDSDNIGYDTREKRSGNYSLFIRHAGFGAPYWTTFRFLSTGQVMPTVVPGEKWVFRAWMKTTSEMKGQLTVTFKNNMNTSAGTKRMTFGPFPEWTEVKIEALAPENAAFAALGLSGSGKGTVWFEPFSMEKK